MQGLQPFIVVMNDNQRKEHRNQPTEDERDFPSKPPLKPDPGTIEHDGHYPPGSIPNPMPGVDPQQTPGIDGPCPIATPTDETRIDDKEMHCA